MAPETASAEQPAPQSPRAGSIGLLAPLLGFRMRRIHSHLTRAFSNRLGQLALKPGGFSALGLIAANPGLSQKRLSEELGQDKATVVSVLDELEGRGWAERRRDSLDRRRHHLHITPAGRQALARMGAEAIANEQVVIETLTDQEASLLRELLDKVYRRAFPVER